jgi:hypothetical protein
MTARRRVGSLLVAGSGRDLTDIRLDVLARGESAGNVQRQDMASGMSNNARPLMMQSQDVIEATLETACLANIDRNPLTVRTDFDEDVNAGTGKILRADRVELELVDRSACAANGNKRGRLILRNQAERGSLRKDRWSH